MRFYMCIFLLGQIAQAGILKTFKSNDIKSIKIESSSGSIKVVKASTKESKVVAVSRDVKSRKDCKTDIEQDKNHLLVKVGRSKGANKGLCNIDLAIELEPTASIDISSPLASVDIKDLESNISFFLGSGSIKIQGMPKSVSGSTVDGNIEVKGLQNSAELKSTNGFINLIPSQISKTIGDVKIKNRSGGIAIDGLRSNAFINSSSGQIKVRFTQVPANGQIIINTSSGNANLEIPENSSILSQFRSKGGTIYNELGDQKDANYKVIFRSGNGNLNIYSLTKS